VQKEPRDVVVVRVSEQGGRDEENFHSPKAQLAKAKLWSEDQGNRSRDWREQQVPRLLFEGPATPRRQYSGGWESRGRLNWAELDSLVIGDHGAV